MHAYADSSESPRQESLSDWPATSPANVVSLETADEADTTQREPTEAEREELEIDAALTYLGTDLRSFMEWLIRADNWTGAKREQYSRDQLVRVVNAIYSASLETDEGEFPAIRLSAVTQQSFVVDTRVTPFAHATAATTDGIVRIARASDPSTSIYAVDLSKEAGPSIWGIVDGQDERRRFDEFESEQPPSQLGELEVVLEGVGRISAYDRGGLLCSLRPNGVILRRPDPLLDPSVGKVFARTTESLAEYAMANAPDLSIDSAVWSAHTVLYLALRRLALRMHAGGHGGLLLFSREVPDVVSLSAATSLEYAHLVDAIKGAVVDHAKHQTTATGRRRKSTGPPTRTLVPPSAFEADRLDNALWTVARLSRVDGAVVLSPDLRVRAFGATVKTGGVVPEVLEAFFDARDRSKELQWKPCERKLGTRHHAALHFCAATADSFAILATEEGDLRAVSTSPVDQMQQPPIVRLWTNMPIHQSDVERSGRQTAWSTDVIVNELKQRAGTGAAPLDHETDEETGRVRNE